MVLLVLCVPTPALAAQEAALQSAPDGTLIVVGTGWHPLEDVVVTLGDERFMAYTDSTGTFELYTGLSTFEGALTVRRAEGSALPPVGSSKPHPLAVLFAESVAQGTALLAVCVVAFAALSLSARTLLRKRS